MPTHKVSLITKWQCDHCGELFEEDQYDKAIEHEEGCSFNPIKRGCYTCHHRLDLPADYSGDFECGHDLSLTVSFIEAMDEGNCPLWEQEAEQ